MVAILIGLPFMAWVWGDGAPADGSIALTAPPFVQTAYAQEIQATQFDDDEAGIAAYFNAGQSIDLDRVTSLYRTIETQTDSYIIGSIGVPDYGENGDPHVYVHTDGWVMAYYHETEPTSKIIDYVHYADNAVIPTMFEQVLYLVAGEIGATTPSLTYYHFAYPNANRLMLVVEYVYDGTGNFSINLPPSPDFQFFEKSWALAGRDSCCAGNWSSIGVDGVEVAGFGTGNTLRGRFGEFESQQITVNTLHSVYVYADDGKTIGGLALVYREQ